LILAPDAVYIDTTGVPIDEVTRQVETLVERALARRPDSAGSRPADQAP
jgi:cytidylate kinase